MKRGLGTITTAATSDSGDDDDDDDNEQQKTIYTAKRQKQSFVLDLHVDVPHDIDELKVKVKLNKRPETPVVTSTVTDAAVAVQAPVVTSTISDPVVAAPAPAPVVATSSIVTPTVGRFMQPTPRNLAKLEAELRDLIGDDSGDKEDGDSDVNDAKDDEDMEEDDDDNDNATMFNSGHKPPKQPVPDDEAHAALRAKYKAKIKRYAGSRARRPKAPFSNPITDDELFMHLHKQYVDDQTLAVNVHCIPAGSGYYATFRCEETCEHGEVHGDWTRLILNKSGCPKCPTKNSKTDTTSSYEVCCIGASIASLPADSRIRREWHTTKNAEIGMFQETTSISSGQYVYLWHWHSDDMRDDHSANCDGHLSFVRVFSITGSRRSGCGFTGCNTHPIFVCCEAQSLLGKFPELCEEYIEASIKALEVFPSSNKKVWWKCRVCANVWQSQIANRTSSSSCGCPHCASSQRETLMFSILQQLQADFLGLNMKITRQQKMGRQRGDFGVELKISGLKIANSIVETDGGQHFKAVEPFGGAAQLKVQQALDTRKNKYCVDHGLTLFRIGNKVNKNHYRFVMLSLILMAIRKGIAPITRFVVHGKNARHQYTKQLAALPNDSDAQLIEF
jgi:very-short-patch-repair endonuclease